MPACATVFRAGGAPDKSADYYHDKTTGGRRELHHSSCPARDFNLGTPGLRLFEADGAVKPNDFRLSLTPRILASRLLSCGSGKISVDCYFSACGWAAPQQAQLLQFTFLCRRRVIHDNRLFLDACWNDDPENVGFFRRFRPRDGARP